jgi:hypothetical protein
MSDLSYEQEVGDCGEINEGTMQHCRQLSTVSTLRRGWQGNPIAIHSNALVPRANLFRMPRLDLDRFEAGKWTLSDD